MLDSNFFLDVFALRKNKLFPPNFPEKKFFVTGHRPRICGNCPLKESSLPGKYTEKLVFYKVLVHRKPETLMTSPFWGINRQRNWELPSIFMICPLISNLFQIKDKLLILGHSSISVFFTSVFCTELKINRKYSIKRKNK